MTVRPIQPADRSEWLRMRAALWPECPSADHAREIDDQLSGRASACVPTAVLVAERPGGGRLCGFVELSVKPLDGFETHPVTYIEGWYVDEDVRRAGVGRALVAAAETWARQQGCAEIGSGCDVTNRVSHAAHLAVGFEPIDDLIFFRKRLAPATTTPAAPSRAEIDWTELLGVPLLVREAVAFVTHPRAGGIDVFLGTTRAERNAAGQELVALHYEAYAEMAEQQLRDLARRARARWPILRLALLHRTGRVPIGEPSVLIAVATPHRAASFEACRWLIDTLKAEVAVWKKEVWPDGTGTWVHP
jgi:molybdopterin synthase catalytic subunit/RimJ/RimL family protein N-acetyltransferase